MPTEEVAIEGFFLYHKPYNAEGDFRREALLGPGLRHHVLTSLQPGQHYSIKLRAFNAAGQSQFSNVVVKRTLSKYGKIIEGWLFYVFCTLFQIDYFEFKVEVEFELGWVKWD